MRRSITQKTIQLQEAAKNSPLPEFLTNPQPYSLYARSDYVVLDFETTNTEKGNALNPQNRIVLACWRGPDGEYREKFGSENDLGELYRDLEVCSFVVCQNSKFELSWLNRAGMDLRKIITFDTMLAEWVIAGNRPWELHLNAICKRLGVAGKLDIVSKLIARGVCPSNIPRRLLAEYCMQDVRATEQCFKKQLQELTERNQLHLAYTRNLLVPVLVDMETHGLRLDKNAVELEFRKVSAEYSEVQANLRDFSDSINWNSGKQKAEFLYDKLGFAELVDPRTRKPRTTDGGARATDSETIQSLKATNKEQRRFKELIKKSADLNAKLTKTLTFFQGICEYHDATFYGIFNQGITATHRLSSSGRPVSTPVWDKPKGVQFQNLPVEYKKLHTASGPDRVLVDVDGAQLEFRIAVGLGNDSVGQRELANDVDVHGITSKFLTENGEPTDRHNSKPVTFRPLFGGSSGSPAVQAYAKFFKAKYTGIAKTQTGWTHSVLNSRGGELITPYGMRFYWPGTRMSRSGYIDNTTSIYNYPIQGLSTGEIIPIAVIHLWHHCADLDAKLLVTIHDSVLADLHKNHAMEFRSRAIVAFTNDVYSFLRNCYKFDFSTTLGVGSKIGTHWGVGEEMKVKVNRSNPLEAIVV